MVELIKKSLIVLTPPTSKNPYYKKYYTKILEFFALFASTVEKAGLDLVKVLVHKKDEKTLKFLKEKINDENIVIISNEIEDIWIRDFSSVLPSNPAIFNYEAEYLEKYEGKEIQNSFISIVKEIGIEFKTLNLNNDGGNFVDNNYDTAIISDKILTDNPSKLREEIIDEIKEKTSLKKVILIPREPDEKLGHSDGMVSFLTKEILILGLEKGDLQEKTYNILKEELADTKIKITILPSNYGEYEKLDGFDSAKGCYVNSLVTSNAVYMPTFDNSEDDKNAEEVFRKLLNNEKPLVTIPSEKICVLGGCVRCLSWQLEDDNKNKFLEYLAKNNNYINNN